MEEPVINPSALTDPRVRKVYDMDGYSLALDIARTRKETGLTFSSEALDEYVTTLSTFVSTRVMRYWNEHGEPPVTMNTLVTVAINEKAEHPEPVVDPDRTSDLLEEALSVARAILKVHEHVGMDTAEDKALHAKACETFHDAIAQIERLRRG